MFFHPIDALTREELLQHIWETQLTSPLRAKVLEIAQTRGCTWQDVFRDTFKQYDIMMEDPTQREEWLRTNEEIERRRGMPFGGDPLLEQDGE